MPGHADASADRVSLVIGGKVHSTWSRYQIDSDFLIPADGWSMTLGLPGGVFPPGVTRGAPVQVRIGSEVVMSGRVDGYTRSVSRQQMSLSLTGRDGAAVLVDCASPVFTSRQLGLEEVIAKVVRPLGVTKIALHAESASLSDKVNVEPGERAWDTLVRAAAGRGLWPWFAPDGTLIIGGPDYTTPPVATLVLTLSGQGNNVVSLSDRTAVNGTFSELTVLAQGHAQGRSSKKGKVSVVDVDPPAQVSLLANADSGGNAGNDSDDSDDTSDDDDILFTTGAAETGFHGLKAVVRDGTVPYYRPQVMVVGDADSQAQVDFRARKAMADARLSGFDLTAEVQGHRTAGGVLWQPGQRVRVKSEPHGIDDVFFLMGREFSGGRPGAAMTTLRLKEDGVWIPDAYPKKRKARKRRAKINKELQVIDVEPAKPAD